MSTLPRFAITIDGVQILTNRVPLCYDSPMLHFVDGAHCQPRKLKTYGYAGVTMVQVGEAGCLTPEAAPEVIFVTFNSDGSKTIVIEGMLTVTVPKNGKMHFDDDMIIHRP